MARLSYQVSFYRSDLKSDVAEALRESLPDIPLQERRDLADRSIDVVLERGNSAVYRGLTKEVVEESLAQTQKA